MKKDELLNNLKAHFNAYVNLTGTKEAYIQAIDHVSDMEDNDNVFEVLVHRILLDISQRIDLLERMEEEDYASSLK